MPDNKLVELSFEFAKIIVSLSDSINVPKSSYMINQIARAGTSIGANIHEAQYAHSRADFIAKLEIALKEANETSYWLRLLAETGIISETDYKETENSAAISAGFLYHPLPPPKRTKTTHKSKSSSDELLFVIYGLCFIPSPHRCRKGGRRRKLSL